MSLNFEFVDNSAEVTDQLREACERALYLCGEDAEKYASLAVEYKTTDPELAELFYKLSGEEMNHMNVLHKAVVTKIGDHRRKKGAPPKP